MKKIQKNVLDYIVKDVNIALERLGVSEKVEIIKEEIANDECYYHLQSKPIKVTPMIYRETIIMGVIVVTEVKEGLRSTIKVSLEYHFKYFDGGANGAKIGNIIYYVNDNLDKDEKDENEIYFFIKKASSIKI